MCEQLITDRTTRSPETTAARLAALLRKGSRAWGLVSPLEFRTRIAGVSAGLGRGRILETRKIEGGTGIRSHWRLWVSLHQPVLRARVRFVYSTHRSRCHTRSGFRPTAHWGLPARGKEFAWLVDLLDCGPCHHILGLACTFSVRVCHEQRRWFLVYANQHRRHGSSMVGQGHSIASTSCRYRTVGDDGRNGSSWRATNLCTTCLLCSALANDPLMGILTNGGSADCGHRHVGPGELGLPHCRFVDTLSIAR